jgi:hypothetical protein
MEIAMGTVTEGRKLPGKPRKLLAPSGNIAGKHTKQAVNQRGASQGMSRPPQKSADEKQHPAAHHKGHTEGILPIATHHKTAICITDFSKHLPRLRVFGWFHYTHLEGEGKKNTEKFTKSLRIEAVFCEKSLYCDQINGIMVKNKKYNMEVEL